jgi:hypothetical protein
MSGGEYRLIARLGYQLFIAVRVASIGLSLHFLSEYACSCISSVHNLKAIDNPCFYNANKLCTFQIHLYDTYTTEIHIPESSVRAAP